MKILLNHNLSDAAKTSLTEKKKSALHLYIRKFKRPKPII